VSKSNVHIFKKFIQPVCCDAHVFFRSINGVAVNFSLICCVKSACFKGSKGSDDEEEEEEGPANPWELPDGGFSETSKYLLAWPITLTLYYSVPQCGKEEYKHLYLVSFLMSTIWIAAYSYIMVWMVAYCGFAV
jgi:hypothetical protein